MKYSVIALACFLAVASAQFQYTTIRPAYKPWVSEQSQASRAVYNSPLTATLRPLIGSQSSYTPRPVFSSTPFPARSVFSVSPSVSVQPELPAEPAPTPAATFEVSATPAPAKWSASAVPVFSSTPFPARSVFSVSPSVSVQPELPAEPAPTPAATFEVSATPAPAKWSASPVPEIAEVSVLPAVRFVSPPAAPVVQVASVVAQKSPVVPAAKIASLPVTRYVSDARGAETLKFVNQRNSNGQYDYAFETNNGIFMQSQGEPRSFYSGEEAVSPVVSQGSFGWISPEGREISMSYYADENGYHPTGSAIPVAPEIPPLIARALEYIARVTKSSQ